MGLLTSGPSDEKVGTVFTSSSQRIALFSMVKRNDYLYKIFKYGIQLVKVVASKLVQECVGQQ